jgi:hypothetical protein
MAWCLVKHRDKFTFYLTKQNYRHLDESNRGGSRIIFTDITKDQIGSEQN